MARLRSMDDQRVGAAIRAVRLKRRLRQVDLAVLAGVSRTTISRVERGHVGSLSVDMVRAVGRALDVRIELTARWRAGDLDRLLSARHSALHERVARLFHDLPDWIAEPEVSFAIYGERGIIDILAWHPGRRALLVIELKTEITDVNEVVGTIDRKRRLATQVAAERGWDVAGASVSIWLIVADSKTNRRRVDSHRAMLRAAFPNDGRSMAGWLRDPSQRMAALSFWTDSHPQNVSPTLSPVRRVSAASRRSS